MSWDWFVFSVNWHCQRHQVSAVIYTGCCGILNMFFLCWVSTNIHSWHPLAWLVIDSLTGTGHWEKMYIGFRLCAGHCCHPLFDTVAAEWECVEENDSSHLAAFGPYSTVRMDLILTVLADGILHHRRPRCAFMPPPHILHQIRKWEGMGKCSETLTSQIQVYLCLSNSHEKCLSSCPW